MSNIQRELSAGLRDKFGKGPARRYRAKGLIPAVIYGGGGEHKALVINPLEFRKALDPERKLNTVFKLTVPDVGSADVMIADHQVDAIRNTVIHVDFVRVDMNKEIVTKIPVSYEGRAVGVLAGGKLQTYRRFVKIAAKPGDVPVKAIVDVSPLEGGQTLHVEDLTLENARFLEDPKLSLAFVEPPKKKKEEEDDGKKKKKK